MSERKNYFEPFQDQSKTPDLEERVDLALIWFAKATGFCLACLGLAVLLAVLGTILGLIP